jgi:hypothetical protein
MHKSILFIWLMVLCGWRSALAQENLIKNAGFEQETKSGSLPAGGWWLYPIQGEARVMVDRAASHSGTASVSLQGDAGTKCTFVSGPVTVSPGDELSFNAWVRGEGLEPGHEQVRAGLAFRQADGKVFSRAYFSTGAAKGTWSMISGVAQAPDGATTVEAHLNYTNAPGKLWFDDVAVVVTSPVSFALAEAAKPWPGPQDVTLRITNRQTNQFRGSIAAVVGRRTETLPVVLLPRASREVKIPITLTGTGAHNYKISLLDSGGTPLRVLEGKFHTKPPLVLYPACPCYHAVGEGAGDTRIDARVSVNPAHRAGLRLAVDVTDASGKQIQTATADASKGETVGVTVRVPVQAPGEFAVTARLIDLAGKEAATARSDVHVCDPGESRVTIGPDGFLRIGGLPHFPIGMYSCGRYDEMGKAGFTGTHNYGITTGDALDAINPNEAQLKDLLDRSSANGMRMMVELPRKAIEKAQWQQVRRRIETFRRHPGLLCWGSEERVARGEAPLTNIAALYRMVRELDPAHPLVLGDTREIIQKLQVDRRDFFPDTCMDAGIWWWYPIPLKDADGNGLDGRERSSGLLQPPAWLTTTSSRKPLWIAIQSYQHPRKDARFPTPAEYRCLAYLSVINGVKGLWFYTGSGQRDYQGKPAGLLNRPEEGHWDYVQKLVGELREFSPVIMAPACAVSLTLLPAGAPVEFTTREREGKRYLIAANKSDRQQSVRFHGPALAGKRAELLFESHPATIEGDSLRDEFTPFGVHVYELQ